MAHRLNSARPEERCWLFLSLVAILVARVPVWGQEGFLPERIQEPWREPPLPLKWETMSSGERPAERAARFQLFRMPIGFLAEPLGLSDDDDPNADSSPGSAGDDRLHVALGSDNPFFDFRSPGDPGGVGYYKLHTQYQLLDLKTAGLCLGLQAATPAGLEGDGAPAGPTLVKPSLAWYQDLDSETSLHGFIGKGMRANSRWMDKLGHGLDYGMAVQRPVPGLAPNPGCCLHMFVEALGRQKFSTDPASHSSMFEVLPGLHCQMGENWWMTGGMVLPVGGVRPESNGLWQITCSWRF